MEEEEMDLGVASVVVSVAAMEVTIIMEVVAD